jgi:hypothetical protein
MNRVTAAVFVFVALLAVNTPFVLADDDPPPPPSGGCSGPGCR